MLKLVSESESKSNPEGAAKDWTGRRTRTENTERKKLCETAKLFWKADRIIWDGGQGEGTQLKKMKRHNVRTLGSEGNQQQSLSFHLLP